MEIGADGYIKGGPAHPSRWRELLPDQPEGRIVALRTVPPGFLMVENFIDREFARSIVAVCEKAPREPHTAARTGALQPAKDTGRISDCIDSASVKEVDLAAVARFGYANLVQNFFRRQIESIERPEVLRYEAGGEYRPHADADNWDAAAGVWRRALDRDFSMLIYLNDDFEGGEIQFLNFGVSLKPKAGLMLAFPSDHRYIHQARPVASGVKYVLAAWARASDSERVETTVRPAVEKF